MGSPADQAGPAFTMRPPMPIQPSPVLRPFASRGANTSGVGVEMAAAAIRAAREGQPHLDLHVERLAVAPGAPAQARRGRDGGGGQAEGLALVGPLLEGVEGRLDRAGVDADAELAAVFLQA